MSVLEALLSVPKHFSYLTTVYGISFEDVSSNPDNTLAKLCLFYLLCTQMLEEKGVIYQTQRCVSTVALPPFPLLTQPLPSCFSFLLL